MAKDAKAAKNRTDAAVCFFMVLGFWLLDVYLLDTFDDLIGTCAREVVL